MKHSIVVSFDKAKGHTKPWLGQIKGGYASRDVGPLSFYRGVTVRKKRGDTLSSVVFEVDTHEVAEGVFFALGIPGPPKQRAYGRVSANKKILWQWHSTKSPLPISSVGTMGPGAWALDCPTFEDGVTVHVSHETTTETKESPLPPSKERAPADLRSAVRGLLDYWFIKYKFDCEDDEERRIWQGVIDAFTPDE